MTDKKEAFPLAWPDGWQRTRPQDQRAMASWKKSATFYRDALIAELERIQSPSSVISTNVPLNLRGALTTGGIEPRDVGVAVYFSKQIKEDFSWQEALDIHEPAPTEQRIQDAFKRLAHLYHPDKGGDMAMFQAAAKHRDNALRWVNRKTEQRFDYVIANDQFREVRLNMAAIVMSLKALRQLDRCGSTGLLERAFKGFSALPAYQGSEAS